MSYDPNDCDYNSQAFHEGFAAGKANRPVDTGRKADASYMEGWLMGNCEAGMGEDE